MLPDLTLKKGENSITLSIDEWDAIKRIVDRKLELLDDFPLVKRDFNYKKIISLIEKALLTDESHYKQWYLEQLLIALVANPAVIREKLQREGYFIEPGLPPMSE